MLSAFHHYQKDLNNIRFVGIHTGHLGFYTDWRSFEIDDLVDSLVKDSGQAVSYPLLAMKATYSDGQIENYIALNESTIRNVTRTMVCDVFINNYLFENFRGMVYVFQLQPVQLLIINQSGVPLSIQIVLAFS